MKHVSFPGADVLTGVSIMLEHFNLDVTDRDIALGMEIPYLLVYEQEQYRAGTALYTPDWINLYLKPFGLRLVRHEMERKAAAAFLRSHAPAMFSIAVTKELQHPVVFSSYENGRYICSNICSSAAGEPAAFSFSAAMLNRRLDETVTICTIEPCEAEEVDFIPLLISSLETLKAYRKELLATRKRPLSREELEALDRPLFQPLMREFGPLMRLIHEEDIAEEMELLSYDYRYLFSPERSRSISLFEHLPRFSIKACCTWLREAIIDRLYAIGAPEDEMDRLVDSYQTKPKQQSI